MWRTSCAPRSRGCAGRLEKSYNSLHDGDAQKAMIGDTIADLDSVQRIFSSLTRISQIEATDRTAAFRTIDLAEVVREVVELFDAAAEEKRRATQDSRGSARSGDGR
jgi:signal transduction histidine kinase